LGRTNATYTHIVGRARISVVTARSITLAWIRALPGSGIAGSGNMALVLRLTLHPVALVGLAIVRTPVVVVRVAVITLFATIQPQVRFAVHIRLRSRCA
jgi:hypothetical protein